MNLALDRDRVVQIFGGEAAALPTCQQLPPNFPGYEPYCPYTMNPGPEGEGSWTAPDIEEAQRLVRRSGTAGMRVVFEYDPVILGPSGQPPGGLHGRAARRARIPREREAVPSRLLQPRQRVPDGARRMGRRLPGRLELHRPTGSRATHPLTPRSGFCDPRIDAMIDRATQVQLDDPAAAGALWAEIDRAIVDQAPYLWLVNPIDVEFVSERVGNYQYSPQWGALLNQLWVR